MDVCAGTGYRKNQPCHQKGLPVTWVTEGPEARFTLSRAGLGEAQASSPTRGLNGAIFSLGASRGLEGQSTVGGGTGWVGGWGPAGSGRIRG